MGEGERIAEPTVRGEEGGEEGREERKRIGKRR